MWNFVTGDWGDLASFVGLLLAFISVGFAIWQACRALSASHAATQAAHQARTEIKRYLRAVNFERAFALIRYIKLLHNSDSWGEAFAEYQHLRTAINDVATGFPGNDDEVQRRLREARHLMSRIEISVHSFANFVPAQPDKVRLYRRLNDVQEHLEFLADRGPFGGSQKETE